jgi:uncharacterized protein YhfF
VTIPKRYEPFWQAFAETQVVDPTSRFLQAFYFDVNEASANELAVLVLAGRKRATTSLLWAYEHDQEPLPKPGDLSIVTDYGGTPRCVIETTAAEVVPFVDVSTEFAATEGDGSLAYWRDIHDVYFAVSALASAARPHRACR